LPYSKTRLFFQNQNWTGGPLKTTVLMSVTIGFGVCNQGKLVLMSVLMSVMLSVAMAVAMSDTNDGIKPT